jgi:hypothetical protein
MSARRIRLGATLAIAVGMLGFDVAKAARLLPGRPELAGALAGGEPGHPGRLSHVRCVGFAEEPTEFACRYHLLRGRLRGLSCHAYIAIDGSTWILIDTPSCHGARGQHVS